MNFLKLPTWMRSAPDSALAELRSHGTSPLVYVVHLLWSLWVFITPLFGGHYDLTWWLMTVGSYPLFLLLFAMTQRVPKRLAHRYALGMGALGMVLLPWYPSGVSYFIYATVMMRPHRIGFAAYLAMLLAANALFSIWALYVGYPWQALLSIVVSSVIVSIVVDVQRRFLARDAALKLSQDEIRRIAATAERERIGRDLHDLLGHTLSLITLKLELSRKLLDRDLQAARREIGETESVARKALAEVRSAVTGIRATDLAAELAAARLMLESSCVHLECGELPSDLPRRAECALALILREAATNIARHAAASRARVELRREGDLLHLSVIDNGRGGVSAEGNGLRGMRERVQALGGALNIDSEKGRGTRIHADIPARASTEEPNSMEPCPGVDGISVDAAGGRAPGLLPGAAS